MFYVLASDDQLARLIVAILDGLVLQWLLDPELDMTQPFQLFGDLLKRSIIKPASEERAEVTDADGAAELHPDVFLGDSAVGLDKGLSTAWIPPRAPS